MEIDFDIRTFIRLAGLAQILLVIGSLAIPKILNWKVELETVKPLIKQMFWTYAAYILTVNLSFGLLSVWDYRELLNGTTLATITTGFISLYWMSRFLVQFLYFDRKSFPVGLWYKVGEVVLVALFLAMAFIYGWACYVNYTRY